MTLVEMLIVLAIIGLLTAISYPSAAAGIDSLRLRTASNEVVTFLNAALEAASRHQQVIELRIAPSENAMAARSVTCYEVGGDYLDIVSMPSGCGSVGWYASQLRPWPAISA